MIDIKEINLGNNILMLRKKRKITQEELAEYTNVSKTSVSKWENGLSYPDITLLPVIASYFNVSVDELIGYTANLSHDEIIKLYKHLSDKFENEELQVMNELIDQYIKKYYSCVELQLYMATLLVNYGVSSQGKINVNMLEKAVRLCDRIIKEGEKLEICNKALSIEGAALLVLNKPKEVIDLLKDKLFQFSDPGQLLANAYISNGEVEKASRFLQFRSFVNINDLVANLLIYAKSVYTDKERFIDAVSKGNEVIKIFKMDQLNSNLICQFYIVAATGYMINEKYEEALKELNKYRCAVKNVKYPYKIAGGKFFDQIDEYLDTYEINTFTPRNESAIKESIVSIVRDNPVFTPLRENNKFDELVKELELI